MKRIFVQFCGLMLVSLSAIAQQSEPPETTVDAIALFNGKAMLSVNGSKPKIIVAGSSYYGVKLLESNTDQARIEVAGHEQILTLDGGVVLSSSLAPPPATGSPDEALVWADENGFFRSGGTINGEPVEFLVDTGANLVVLSGDQADHIELEYENSQRSIAATASGTTELFLVTLDKITFQGIELTDVQAGVVPGDFPSVPLLGMSYLEALDMRREGDRMMLRKRR